MAAGAEGAAEPDYVGILLALLQTSAALSVFGALSIIAYFWVNYSHRNFALRLVVWLSVTNIGTSLGFFMESQASPTVCIASASIVRAPTQTFFSVSSFLWSCCIAVNLYWTTFGKRFRNDQLEPFYLGICLVIPTICTVVPIALDMYTKTFIEGGVGCWYQEQYTWGRIVFFDGWIMLAWIVNLLSYGFALRNNSSMMMESLYVDHDPASVQISLNNQALVRSLLLVFVLCWTWSIVLAALALANVTADQPASVWIVFLFCIFAPMQGFFNFLVFMIKSAEFRAIYVRMWLSLLTCRKLDYDLVDTDESAWAARMMNRTVSINYGAYKDDMLAINS